MPVEEIKYARLWAFEGESEEDLLDDGEDDDDEDEDDKEDEEEDEEDNAGEEPVN